MNKKITLTQSARYSAIFFLFAPTVFAGNLSIVPLSDVPLPSSVISGQTVVAYFVVTNNSDTLPQNGFQVQGLPTTAAQNTFSTNYYTSSPTCGNPINLDPGSNCLLQIDITGDVAQNVVLCNRYNCTQSSVPLSVAVATANAVSAPLHAFVTQYGAAPVPVQVCDINQTTGVMESCHSAGGGALFSTGAINPQGIQIGNGGSTAYITAYGSGSSDTPYVYQCPIYANTAMFGPCTLSEITSPTGYTPYYGFLALNANNTASYLVDGSNARILDCPISGEVIQSDCVDTGATELSSDPVGITLNDANTIAYIGSYDGYLTTCSVNGSSFYACGQKTGDGVISFSSSEIMDAALNSTSSILYITDNSNGNIYGCDVSSIDTSSSTFPSGSCFIAAPALSPQPWGITLSETSNMVYATTFSNIVYSCAISPANNQLSCVTTTGFTDATGIALL